MLTNINGNPGHTWALREVAERSTFSPNSSSWEGAGTSAVAGLPPSSSWEGAGTSAVAEKPPSSHIENNQLPKGKHIGFQTEVSIDKVCQSSDQLVKEKYTQQKPYDWEPEPYDWEPTEEQGQTTVIYFDPPVVLTTAPKNKAEPKLVAYPLDPPVFVNTASKNKAESKLVAYPPQLR